MTSAAHDDPADTLSAGSRSWRRWVLVVTAGVLLAALVRATLLETWFVPETSTSTGLRAGERVAVLKVGSPRPGDVVLVDLARAGELPSRATAMDDGLVGRLLGSVASVLGVRPDEQSVARRVVALDGDSLQVLPPDLPTAVGSGSGAESGVGASSTAAVPDAAVLGRVVARVWPIDRLGPVPSLTSAETP